MVGGEKTALNAAGLAIMRKHPRPTVNAVPRDFARQRHNSQTLRGVTGNGTGGCSEHHQAVGALVSPPYLESIDQPGYAVAAFSVVSTCTGNAPAEMPKDHLH